MKLRRLIVSTAIVAASVLPIAATTATAKTDTSPSISHPYWWGESNYQIQGTGPLVEYFVGWVTNTTLDQDILVEFTVNGPEGQQWGPFETTIAPCARWNWSIGVRRDLPLGGYWIHYLFIYGAAAEHVSWSYNVE